VFKYVATVSGPGRTWIGRGDGAVMISFGNMRMLGVAAEETTDTYAVIR